jgi:hypothetical protein
MFAFHLKGRDTVLDGRFTSPRAEKVCTIESFLK